MSRLLSVLALVIAAAAFSAAPAVASHGPSQGAAGIGDPLFPTLGNGGYDARHYSLDLRYAATAAATAGSARAAAIPTARSLELGLFKR